MVDFPVAERKDKLIQLKYEGVILSFDNLIILLGVGYLLLEVAAVLLAVHAAMSVRSSQGAIAWSLSLITFPLLSVPLYIIFGRNKLAGYVKAGRIHHDNFQNIVVSLKEQLPKYCQDTDSLNPPLETLSNLTDLPVIRGNNTQLLIDGKQTFDAIFKAIDSAQNYIIVQFFIVKEDGLGNQLKQKLIAKSKEGIQVYFLTDTVGSHNLSRAYQQALWDAGVHVQQFSAMGQLYQYLHFHLRNHRKIVVVDGTVAFIGGHNVGDSYLGLHPRLSPWRDTHLMITGPAVLAVQMVFLEDWHWVTKQLPNLSWTPETDVKENQDVLILPTGPADELDTGTLFMVSVINSAKHRCWIVSPYFVPDESVVSALQLAALRGADVRILLPEKPDHRIVYLASYSYFDGMIKTGVKLFRYHKGFLHQKVLLVDDDLASIGTMNLDNRSLKLNFEISAILSGKFACQPVNNMLENDFKNSTQIENTEYQSRNLLFKAGVKISRLFSPVL